MNDQHAGLREQAARYALNDVHDNMVLGLGSGRTAASFVEGLAHRIQQGELHGIVAVPTSKATEVQALRLGIPLVSLAEYPRLDLAVDGADEVDPGLNLIKGLGRALLREKIVEIHAQKLVVVVDESKLVGRLGEKGPLPVEIACFEYQATINWLNTLGCKAELWLEADGSPVVTDNGNYLVRCWFEHGIADARALDQALTSRPGVVEHGLFLDMATQVIVAGVEGLRILEKNPHG